jgi:hypothetical protein
VTSTILTASCCCTSAPPATCEPCDPVLRPPRVRARFAGWRWFDPNFYTCGRFQTTRHILEERGSLSCGYDLPLGPSIFAFCPNEVQTNPFTVRISGVQASCEVVPDGPYDLTSVQGRREQGIFNRYGQTGAYWQVTINFSTLIGPVRFAFSYAVPRAIGEVVNRLGVYPWVSEWQTIPGQVIYVPVPGAEFDGGEAFLGTPRPDDRFPPVPTEGDLPGREVIL